MSARGFIVALASLGLGIAVAACGDDGSGTATFEHEDFPFTFDHPDNLELSEDVSVEQSLGSASDATLALGLNDENGLIFQRFTLNTEVGADNLELAKQETDALFQQVDPEASGEPGELIDLPSLTYESVEIDTPTDGLSRVTLLFDGDQEYLFNCQSTPDDRDEIEAACDQMLETLAPAGDAG